jgi:hypothetical protein
MRLTGNPCSPPAPERRAVAAFGGRCHDAALQRSVMEEPDTGAHEGYVVFGTRGHNFIGTCRASGMRDKSDTMSSGPVDVVAERNETVRCKNDVCKSTEPTRALLWGKRFGYCIDHLSQSSLFFNREVALDVPNLPVDPVLTPNMWMKSE